MMNENEYAKVKRKVKRTRSQAPESRSYWDAFLRGLYRGFKGPGTGEGELTNMLKWAAGDKDASEIAAGYFEGLEHIKAWEKRKERAK